MGDTFFHIKNIEKFSLINKIILILSLTFVCQAGYSWSLFGYDNFEECLSKEMKGRDMKQESIVSASCRKKYPKLPSFTNKNKFGQINCSIDGKSEVFPVSISSNLIKSYLGDFIVLVREEEFIRGVNKDKKVFIEPPIGASIVINFYHGTGAVMRITGNSNGESLTCYE